jgi:NAD(P)-dependent dehydrogenase (short-subunit alcohol dehydrogenase family)
MAHALAARLPHAAARVGIRVNAIAPGITWTPFMGQSEKESDEYGGGLQLLGRAGRGHEIASLAAYMLSDEASFVTGAHYDIDGGWALKA